MHLAVVLSLCVTSVYAGCNGLWDWDTPTFLDNFVNRIDPEFDPDVDEILYYNKTTLGCHSYVLNFTSGRWMTSDYSDRPIWWHYLTINIPLEDNVNFLDAGMLFIDGGSNGGPPGEDDEFIVSMCALTADTGSVTAVLKQVPNQDIIFVDDPDQQEQGEGDLLSYLWADFMGLHEDPADYIEADYERIGEFPMARAGVRALDVMNVFSKKKIPGSDLTRFAVSGGSKRGWSAWSVAHADPRVEYTAPLVISIPNTVQTFHHHYENLGGWSIAMAGYWFQNFTKDIDEPQTQLMFDQIDPACYAPRLDILKTIGCASNDEYFLPDASHDFYNLFPDPKFMLMMENAEHTLAGEYLRVMNHVGSIWYAHLTDFPIPSMTWTMDEDATGGNLRITTDTIPLDYVAWHGDTVAEDGRRDFRLVGLDGFQRVRWNTTDDAEWTVLDDYNYIVHYNRSTDAPYRGFKVDMFFEGPRSDMEFELTTEVAVIPNTRPYPPCVGEECRGNLV